MGRVGQAQMNKLLDLLSEDGVLVHGKVSYSNTNKQNFWKRIALQLNSVDGGVNKTTWKWCKMWADWKNKTKKKANILLQKKHCSSGLQPAALSNLELRLLKMIEYPIDDKAGIISLDMVSKVEIPETTSDQVPDFLMETYDTQLSQDPMVSDQEEETTTLEYFASKSKFYNEDDIINDSASKLDACEESSDVGQKVKMKVSGNKLKKKKASFEEFKIRTKLKLEKDRVEQKSEELRLKALELKLKGEELRLKEIEMNKINYLTTVEEEKLKCFKHMSSSLKELLDRTRSGNIRFHNVP